MHIKDDPDEYSTRDQPAQPSSYDRYGFDERDGPPEEEEERGYVDDPNEPWRQVVFAIRTEKIESCLRE